MKMMSRKLAMPLLGVLLWVISIHAGTFATATLLPPPLTGFGSTTKTIIQNHNHDGPKITEKDLNRSVSFGNSVINRMLRLETNLGWSDVHVKKGTPSHGQLIASHPDEEALKQGRDALVATKATIHLMNMFCHKHHLSPADCSKYISSFPLASTSLESSCQKQHKLCSQEELLSPYRSFDGTCNNEHDGPRGAAYTAYRRLLHAEYLDGVQEPRRAVNKKLLPSARLVSSTLIKGNDESHSDLTQAVAQWSEFIEHDLSHTATSKMVHSDSTIECCASSGNHLSPRYIHPFCAPISVPSDDRYYAQHGLDCMTYVRSVPAFRHDCTFGPLEQVNQATHFLDFSQIYGTTLKKAAILRTYDEGQLDFTTRHDKVFLPVSHSAGDDCQLSEDNSLCFVSGDSRVNIHPQLTAMHTIWLREHNRVAKVLSELNPAWDDETLFQEARKIVTAEMQHITYNEWLPLVLGKKYFTKIQKYNSYDENVNPSVSNEFATAAVRVLNSLKDGKLNLYKEDRLVNTSLNLRNHFNNPDLVEEPGYLDALIRGLATQSSQQLDLKFPDDISTHLFSNGAFGFDIFSLDIQRGRDHGLPPYTSYRTLCGLPEVSQFKDLSDVMSPEVIESLSRVYNSPRDIDLIAGGIAEKPAGDSLFGPTFSCIVADQFLRTRRGDRYFYTNENQPAPFGNAQLREIEKVTLARIFCDNGDDIEMMQPQVFKRISESNRLMKCDSGDIPRVNLRMWMDSRRKYY
ncbi:peroxidase precursor [Tribolium castaneum]|nr:peroxidase precursor [Tribolium castaneum]|eukprot:NP_001164313.1 peroxidase precursor [Tribolium castaneum]